MTTELDLRNDYSWVGEFWIENDIKSKCAGTLTYSLQNGIHLILTSQIIQGKEIKKIFSENNNTKINIIHGHIQEFGLLTLFNNLQRTDSNNRQLGTKDYWLKETEFLCEVAIFGDHFSKENLSFSACRFRINNLNAFCKRSDAVKLKQTLIANLDEINIKLHRGGTVSTKSIESIYDPNEEKKQKIIAGFKKVLNECNQSSFFYTEDVQTEYYYFLLKSTTSLDIKQCKDLIWKIAHLFACFCLSPIFPTKIKLLDEYDSVKKYYKRRHSVLLSMYLTNHKIIKNRKPKEFWNLPITYQKVSSNFQVIIKNWMDFLNVDFDIIFSAIENHLYNSWDKSPVQYYILLIAAMEQWSVRELKVKEDDYNRRYDIFINEYASDEIKNLFLRHLPPNSNKDEIGKHLGGIRNVVIHFEYAGKGFKKYSEILKNPAALSNLCELISTLFVMAIYDKIQIDDIDNFRENFEKYIAVYSQT